MILLKRNILLCGWCFPIVLSADNIIVDGFHRWTLASTDLEIRSMSNAMVPAVFIAVTKESGLRAATVRFNRARGQHGILAMGEIVRSMLDDGMKEEQVMEELGMEREEVRRLSDERASPDRVGKESFGRGWEPAGK